MSHSKTIVFSELLAICIKMPIGINSIDTIKNYFTNTIDNNLVINSYNNFVKTISKNIISDMKKTFNKLLKDNFNYTIRSNIMDYFYNNNSITLDCVRKVFYTAVYSAVISIFKEHNTNIFNENNCNNAIAIVILSNTVTDYIIFNCVFYRDTIKTIIDKSLLDNS